MKQKRRERYQNPHERPSELEEDFIGVLMDLEEVMLFADLKAEVPACPLEVH